MPISSLLFVCIDTVKSPSVIDVITFVSFFTGRITICTTRSTSTARISAEIRPITSIDVRTVSISEKMISIGIYDTKIQSVPSICAIAVIF